MASHLKLTNNGTHRAPYGSIGAAIKALREKNLWTQVQLAKKVDRTQSAIASYESGRICPSVETVRDLAYVFNVPLEMLLSHKRSLFA